MNHSSHSVMVIDNGLFVHVAERLSRDFGKTYYYSPWISAFAEMRRADIGQGFENVTRILNIWDYVEKTDLFVFPDLYHADLQKHLRSMGKRVWGMGPAEWLETDRQRCKKWMKEQKMPLPEYWSVRGLDELKALLEKEKDVYAKPSFWRGTGETFHHEKMFMTEPRLEKMEHKLGARKTDIEFVVERGLEAVSEYGYDGWTVDGQLPEKSLWGIEIKDLGYLGVFKKYDQLPKQMQYVNEKLCQVFRSEQCRGFFSTEIRVDPDGIPFLIDPTIRMPSPPSELYMEMIENVADVIWSGGEGIMIQPKNVAKYGAIAIIFSKTMDEDWIAINVDKNVRQFVKFNNWMKANGHDYIVPLKTELNEVGSVIGYGDTVDEAVDAVKEHAEGVEGLGLEIRIDKFDDANAQVEALEETGVTF